METPWDRERWADALAELIGLLLPVVCVGCAAPDRALCRRCRAALAAWPRCVRLVAGVRLDAAFAYDGLVRTVVLDLKLRGRVDLAGVLGRPTGALVRDALAVVPAGAVVLRIPPSRGGRRRRGFDPVVLLLARGGVRGTERLRRVRRRDRPSVAGVVGGVARSGGLGGTGHGQKERTAVERVAATVGTLRAVGVAGRDVMLVDDVVTTGVTMAEAVRAVRAAGGRVVRCVATASVES